MDNMGRIETGRTEQTDRATVMADRTMETVTAKDGLMVRIEQALAVARAAEVILAVTGRVTALLTVVSAVQEAMQDREIDPEISSRSQHLVKDLQAKLRCRMRSLGTIRNAAATRRETTAPGRIISTRMTTAK